MHNPQIKVYNRQFEVYNRQFEEYNLHFEVYNPHFEVFNLHSKEWKLKNKKNIYVTSVQIGMALFRVQYLNSLHALGCHLQCICEAQFLKIAGISATGCTSIPSFSVYIFHPDT